LEIYPNKKSFIIKSIFESGLAEFDNNVIFLNLNTLEEFSNLSIDERNLENLSKRSKKYRTTKKSYSKQLP
jgi:lipoprotein-releasing system permease protein